MTSPICLIDCDPIKYAAAHLGEERDKENDLIKLKDVSHCYYFVNAMVKKCIRRCESKEYRTYLTPLGDRSNFRFKLYEEYKANRKDLRKPYYLGEIQTYIKERWKADVSVGEEADDVISIAHYALHPFGVEKEQVNSIICSIDKDFNNCAGWHYNPRNDEFYFISEIEALQNFYLQILTGDRADNVPRVKHRYQSKKAEQKIKEALTEKELYDIVYNEVYEVIYGGDGAEKTRSLTRLQVDIEIKEWMLQQGRLLWLRRKENEMWQLPKEQINEFKKKDQDNK